MGVRAWQTKSRPPTASNVFVLLDPIRLDFERAWQAKSRPPTASNVFVQFSILFASILCVRGKQNRALRACVQSNHSINQNQFSFNVKRELPSPLSRLVVEKSSAPSK